MVRVMSIEGRKYNIRVMGLAPGAYTRMTSDLPRTASPIR
jgi:NAD(P)-dependent dehydrogenase (short-subunit alcohol dehydrogenase family)